MTRKKVEITVDNYKILSTGVDGGHHYLKAEIDYKEDNRRIVIFFADKADERKLKQNCKIRIHGHLQDEGNTHSLSLLESKILEIK